MIAVVTDSCAAVPQPLVQELEIEVVPYHVHTVHGTLRDGVDMSPDEFYAWVKTAPQWPTTANPSVGEYLAAYQRVVARAAGAVTGIVAVSMTGAGSGAGSFISPQPSQVMMCCSVGEGLSISCGASKSR